jgi:hypothetical protein
VIFALLALVFAAQVTAPPATPTPAPPAAQHGGFPGLPANHAPKVEIAWNRLYDTDALYALFDQLVAAYPALFKMEVIGHSTENREMRVYTLTNFASGADSTKPAMWIDANVHGNEVQGGEAVLYTAWYLLENYGHNPRVDELLNERAFYLLPSVNPDGRAAWFRDANSASSSRTGRQPMDDDGDGLFDEDPADDLDGDGHIVQMRKHVPGEGNLRLDPDDPRLMLPVPPNDKGIKGDWIMLGQEGIDNDGDGRINEDGVGGYDMNRSDPSMWMPEHVQGGAGPYPLYWPEARCIAEFLLKKPNLAALQSFHNSGGMILRGPGAEAFGEYARADLRVFDELGKDGERMLPFYRYMIIWKDLYSVFGGFATWGYEGLGVISFTNELWADAQQYPDASKASIVPTGRAGDLYFDDALMMGAGYVPWHAYEHPLYGAVEIGGFKKDVGRVPPTFLIEEMVHRNALFCLKHAEAMPIVKITKTEVTDLGGGVRAVDVVFENTRAIPTRTAQAASAKIGLPDLFTLEGKGLEVLAAGWRSDRFRPENIDLVEREPARLLSERGIPGRGELRVRWFVRGTGTANIVWSGEKARTTSAQVELR